MLTAAYCSGLHPCTGSLVLSRMLRILDRTNQLAETFFCCGISCLHKSSRPVPRPATILPVIAHEGCSLGGSMSAETRSTWKTSHERSILLGSGRRGRGDTTHARELRFSRRGLAVLLDGTIVPRGSRAPNPDRPYGIETRTEFSPWRR